MRRLFIAGIGALLLSGTALADQTKDTQGYPETQSPRQAKAKVDAAQDVNCWDGTHEMAPLKSACGGHGGVSDASPAPAK